MDRKKPAQSKAELFPSFTVFGFPSLWTSPAVIAELRCNRGLPVVFWLRVRLGHMRRAMQRAEGREQRAESRLWSSVSPRCLDSHQTPFPPCPTPVEKTQQKQTERLSRVNAA